MMVYAICVHISVLGTRKEIDSSSISAFCRRRDYVIESVPDSGPKISDHVAVGNRVRHESVIDHPHTIRWSPSLSCLIDSLSLSKNVLHPMPKKLARRSKYLVPSNWMFGVVREQLRLSPVPHNVRRIMPDPIVLLIQDQ